MTVFEKIFSDEGVDERGNVANELETELILEIFRSFPEVKNLCIRKIINILGILYNSRAHERYFTSWSLVVSR